MDCNFRQVQEQDELSTILEYATSIDPSHRYLFIYDWDESERNLHEEKYFKSWYEAMQYRNELKAASYYNIEFHDLDEGIEDDRSEEDEVICECDQDDLEMGFDPYEGGYTYDC